MPSVNGSNSSTVDSSAILRFIPHLATATRYEDILAELDEVLTAVDMYLVARLSGSTHDTVEIMALHDRSGQSTLPVGTTYDRTTDLPPLDLHAPTIFPAYATECRVHRWTFMSDVHILAIFPLVVQQQPIGLLILGWHTPAATPDLPAYPLLAHLLAVALATTLSHEAVAAQALRVERFYKASEIMAAQQSTNEVLRVATDLLVDPVGYRNAWLGLVDPSRTTVQGKSGAGVMLTPALIAVEHALDGPSIAAQVVQSGTAQVVDAFAQSRREGWFAHAQALDLRHSITVPLRTQANVIIGVLGVGSSSRQVEPDEIGLVAAFANQVATTLERVEATTAQHDQVLKLSAAYAQQESLLSTIRDLATPVLPVFEGIIILPLIGHLDTNRSMQIMEVLLQAIHRDHAHVAILDITGVPVIDTSVANHLIQATRAAALLGTTCVLVGITPEVAQTMVQLGIDMGTLRTQSNLQTGLLSALQHQGVRMVSGRTTV